MFWNKKKKEKDESEEDLFEYTEENSEDNDEDTEIKTVKNDNDDDLDDEGKEDFDISEYFDETEEESSETVGRDSAPKVTVTVRVDSLSSLVEFISLRHPLNLQFMKKETGEVFELREAHLRIARVWGTVSMARECSAMEYAKIMLAIELLENPDDFYVLSALTENDLKKAMEDFCEEKYGEKSKKYANNSKKFAKLVESNGDEEEWKLFAKELTYKKTEDFCEENGITFSESNEEDTDE